MSELKGGLIDRMRIVFMGTPEFAVPSLLALVESGADVALVVTQPDRPRGRGGALSQSPVKETAKSLGLAVAQPDKLAKIEDCLKSIAPDFIVTAAYGHILRKSALAIPKYGCVNVHASLLPKYRGASPIHQAILNGDPSSGVTVMMMSEGVDEGDIVAQESLRISPQATTGSLSSELADLGARVLPKALAALREGEIKPVAQEYSAAAMAPRVTKADGALDFSAMGAAEVERRVRAFAEWPGAYAWLEAPAQSPAKAPATAKVPASSKASPTEAPVKAAPAQAARARRRFTILKAAVDTPSESRIYSSEPGDIVSSDKRAIGILCADGARILALRIKFDGGRPMDASECWHNIKIGSRAGLPD